MTILNGKITIGDTFYKKISTSGIKDPRETSISTDNNYTLYLSFRGPCDIDLTSTNCFYGHKK